MTMKITERKLEQEDQKEAPIHGDVLQSIFSHVPLIHLVPACHVSKSWKRAVLSSLRHFNRPKPWLMVHTQRIRSPYVTTTHAYDPRSHVWVEVKQTPVRYVSALRSSNSNLLYMLSPSKLSFSLDPLHLTWHHTHAPPLVWRTDPIVALVGHRIVVAGGSCDFEDNPLAVEIYDLKSRTWDTCDSMPSILRDSAASTWLSIAANNDNLFVTEKSSGVTHSFDPNTKKWNGPYDLRQDPSMLLSIIGFAGDRLILVGLIGEDASNVKSVKMWEVTCESSDIRCGREIGDMPTVLVEKLIKSERSRGLMSISLISTGDFVHICNASEPDEVIVCEFRGAGGGGARRWGSVRNMLGNGENRMERFVFSCSNVGIGDLQVALRLDDVSFQVRKSIKNDSA